MPAPLPTARLAFREMTPDDLDDMAALLGDPQVMRYYPHPKSREEASAWIAWSQRLYRDHGFGLWLVTLRETGGFVGDCGLTPQQVDGVTEIEVGYHVRTALQGRGLATEAAAACRDYARDVLRLERLIAIIDPRNRPSQRVAEKVGLVVERESNNHGRWSSAQLIYAMSLVGPRAADQATHDEIATRPLPTLSKRSPSPRIIPHHSHAEKPAQSASITLDRYGHLFPEELDHSADRLDRLHAQAGVYLACTDGSVASLGQGKGPGR